MVKLKLLLLLDSQWSSRTYVKEWKIYSRLFTQTALAFEIYVTVTKWSYLCLVFTTNFGAGEWLLNIRVKVLSYENVSSLLNIHQLSFQQISFFHSLEKLMTYSISQTQSFAKYKNVTEKFFLFFTEEINRSLILKKFCYQEIFNSGENFSEKVMFGSFPKYFEKNRYQIN